MATPVTHIEKLRTATARVITGLHDMQAAIQDIESFCLDWADDAGQLHEPHITTSGEQPAPDENRTPADNYPTLEETRDVLAKLAQAGYADKIRELLTKHNAEKLSEVPPEQRQALIDEAQGIQ